MLKGGRYTDRRFNFFATVLALFSTLLIGCAQPFVSVSDDPRVKVTLRKNTVQSELRVHVFEPDSQCKFEHKGLISIEGLQRVHSVYLRPGRKYFRVAAEQGAFIGIDGGEGDVSFVLTEGEEYVIEYKSLGTEFVGTGTNLEYELNYLYGPLSQLKDVETDYFSVCEREKSL